MSYLTTGDLCTVDGQTTCWDPSNKGVYLKSLMPTSVMVFVSYVGHAGGSMNAYADVLVDCRITRTYSDMLVRL